MKKIALLLLLFCSISAYIFACSPIFYSYYKINGKTYFGTYYSPEIEVVGVDTTSFITDFISPIYAKDKNHVYFSGKILPLAKPQTFTFLGGIIH